MISKLNTSHQKERYTEAELRQYFGLTKKFKIFSKEIFYLIIGFAFISFISPLLPPKFGWANWTFSSNSKQYLSNVMDFALLYILIAVLIVVVLLLENSRYKLDRRLGYKLVYTQKITGIILLHKRKLLILNSWIPFILNENRLSFQTVKSGQLIKTFRTGTFRLLGYIIYDG